MSPAVPQVVLPGGAWGAGFLVERDGKPMVVTSFHVVAGAIGPVTVGFVQAERGQVAGVRLSTLVDPAECLAHPEADLALLPLASWKSVADLRKEGIRPLELAPPGSTPRPGEEILTVGHPAGPDGGPLLLSSRFGEVSGPPRVFPPGATRFLQMTAGIYPGNSGGPVCDERCRVIGISTLKQLISGGTDSDDLSFAVDVVHLHELLDGKAERLVDRVRRETRDEPLASRWRETLVAILASGYVTLEKGISIELGVDPGGASEGTLDLSASRDYALWVIASSSGAGDVPDLQIVVRGGPSKPTVGLRPSPLGTLVHVEPRSPGEHRIRVRNTGRQPVKVRVRGFSRPRK